MPTHVRCEEHPNRSTWPKLNKFPNCTKTTLEGVVTTENHTHGQIGSTWLHLMPPNVPGAWLSHQMPLAKSCCWGAGFGTLRSGGGKRRGAHRGRHTYLSSVHSSKLSIYSRMMPCSAQKHIHAWGLQRSKLLFLNPLLHPSHPQYTHIVCYWLMDIPELATLQPQLFQLLSAAYKRLKEMDETKQLPCWQFAKCFALFSQKRTKPKWDTGSMTSKVLRPWKQHADFKVDCMCPDEVMLWVLPLHASPSHFSYSLSSPAQGVKPKLHTAISGSRPSKRRQTKPLPLPGLLSFSGTTKIVKHKTKLWAQRYVTLGRKDLSGE